MAVLTSISDEMLGEGFVRQFLQRARAGDAEAFRALMRENERMVLRLAQRLLLNREAARDVSQEVFLRLFKNLSKLDQRQEVASWLYRTTANLCFDLLRRDKRDLPLDVVIESQDLSLNPEESASASERKKLLLEALKALSPREREAVVLRDLEGRTTTEVAELMRATE